jgi:hypothetical protein
MRRRDPGGTRRRVRCRDERGAILPLVAVLLGVVLIASLWGANAAALYGLRREEQRAADLSALAGAANIPLTAVLGASEPATTACDQAARLLSPSTAPLANNLAATKTGPTCASGVRVEPLFDWALIGHARDALDAKFAPIRALDLCGPLRATIDPFLGLLSGTDCTRLEGVVDALPDNLSPATLTPRVRVTIEELAEAPVPIPAFSGRELISAAAKARRRFKNVVVVPAVRTSEITGVPQYVTDLVSGAPAPLTDINLNIPLAQMRNTIIPKLWEANAALGSQINPLMPPGYAFDLSGLILDVQDVYDPPTASSPPSPLQVASEAITRGEPVIVLRLFRMPVLGIPAFDFTAAYLSPLADGHVRATPIPVQDLSRAKGLFGATLIR